MKYEREIFSSNNLKEVYDKIIQKEEHRLAAAFPLSDSLKGFRIVLVFEKEIKRSRTIIEQKVDSADFNKFWKNYPSHKNKKLAEKAWLKIKTDEYPAVLKGLEGAIGMGVFSDPQFIPHPSTWLNGRRWEDDLKVKAPFKKPPLWEPPK
jgi:hypothetical protein